MTSVRTSYSYISKFVKKYNGIPAEKFENDTLYHQTVLLKIVYDFRIEISFMEK